MNTNNKCMLASYIRCISHNFSKYFDHVLLLICGILFFGFRGNDNSVPLKITVSVVMTMNVEVSFDVTSCSLVTVYGRFGRS